MNAEATDGARKSSPSPPLTSNDDELSLEPKSGSQTQLCQMTASSLPPPTPDSTNKWNCEVCTYENFPLSRKCTMCRSSKPLLGEDIFRLQDGASALEAPQELGAEAVTEKMKPMRISSPQGQPSDCAGTKWSCSRCTYENWPKSQKCAMCGTSCISPVGAPVPSDKSRNHNNMGINDIASLNGIHCELDNRRSKWKNNIDWVWLQACLGVVEGKVSHVEEYLSSGGDPARALTAPEVRILDRASAFDAGYTLVHLAIRFQREEILTTLLSRISGGGSGLKRVPSYIAPDLAAAIRRHMASCIRHKKGAFACRYMSEFCTFSLPAEIEDLPAAIQEQLFSELLDREVQETLEAEPVFINWSLELTMRLGSRLYALWNRSAGDCLLDAIAQSAYGIFDGDGTLRRTLAATLHASPFAFYERWAEAERRQAARAHYVPDDGQLRAEWARLLSAADTPAQPLHQLHIFALAHVMRRPIIVYGVNVVHSFRGEAIGYARFQGVYLPLLWEQEFCSKSPLCVGYTRGHFSALVPCAPCSSNTLPYICREQKEEDDEYVFLPLTDSEGKLLPVHFLNCDEMADCEGLLRRWVSARVTGGGVLTARQRLHTRPLLVAQMLEEWLNHYRRLAQQTRGPFPPRLAAAEYSSGPDTDDE